MKNKTEDFIRYEKTLQKDLAFEEAKRISTGEDIRYNAPVNLDHHRGRPFSHYGPVSGGILN